MSNGECLIRDRRRYQDANHNSRDHASIYTLHGEPIFFQHLDGPVYPTLRTLHKCMPETSCGSSGFLTVRVTDPSVLPVVGIDRGAIRFLLQGAHMMCPGMTSKGGYLPPTESELLAGTPVALHAEGKEHAVGIGILKLSTEEIKRVNKNVGVETITYLGDDLWHAQKL